MVSNEEIIAALLSNRTIEKTAKALKISPGTLKKYMKEPQFCEEYRTARSELLQTAYNDLASGVNEAVTTVREVMQNKQASPQIRLNAAQIYLNTTLRLNEQIDVMQDITEIKARLAQGEE